MESGGSNKKRKHEQQQQTAFDLLTDDAVHAVFQFVGRDQYFFIARINRRFRRLYSNFQEKEHRKILNSTHPEAFQNLITTKLTSTASIAESLSRAKLFHNDSMLRLRQHFSCVFIKKDGTQEMSESFHPIDFLRDSVALRHEKADILFFIGIGSSRSLRICRIAAKHGHLDLLKLARANGCPWETKTCADAARAGHLELLQWARAKGCPWNEYTCELAAQGGHLELLQWARSQGCPWDIETCAGAAYFGHLELLQWARAKGCPWHEYTCELAAHGGHLELLDWARQNEPRND